MNIDYKVIGNRIKQARKTTIKLKRILPNILEVSNSYVSRIERGTTKLSLELLVKICAYLNISPSYMLLALYIHLMTIYATILLIC